MSNQGILNTKELTVNGTITSHQYVKFGHGGNGACGKKLTVDGNIIINGTTTFCGAISSDGSIVEKTPLNGIDVTGTEARFSVATPITNYNEPNCNTWWGYNSLINLDSGLYNSAFGYSTGFVDENSEGLSIMGKNIFATGYDGNEYPTCLGANIASDAIDDNWYESQVAFGSGACQSHDYFDSSTAIGYRTLGNDPGYWSGSYDNHYVGAHAAEYLEYADNNGSVGAYTHQYATYAFDSYAFGYRVFNLLGLNYNSDYSTGLGSNVFEFLDGSLEYSTENSGMGYAAGRYQVSGTGVTLIGSNAGIRGVYNNYSTMIGHKVFGMQDIIPSAYARYHVAIGNQSMYQYNNDNPGTEDIDGNTACGHQTLYSMTNGIKNTLFGNDAMYYATTASRNTVIGHSAMYNCVDGNDNTIAGNDAYLNGTGGDQNVIIGNNTVSNVSGSISNSVIVGNSTGNFNVPGNDNVLIGHSANLTTPLGTMTVGIGNNLDIKGDNVAIGNNSNCSGLNSLVLGNNSTDNGNSNVVCLASNASASGSNQIVLPNGFVLAGSASTTAAAAEVTTITTIGDSSNEISLISGIFYSFSLPGACFIISSPTVDYYVWFSVSYFGPIFGTDPLLPGRTGINVLLLLFDSSATIASKISIALNAYLGGTVFSCVPGPSSVTITHLAIGACPNISGTDISIPPFIQMPYWSFSVSQQGASPGSLASKYFLLNAPYSVGNRYYVWMNNGGVATDPGTTAVELIGSGRTGIPVVITNGDNANTIATLTAAAIDANPDFIAPVPGANIITVTNAATGGTEDARDANLVGDKTQFTFNILTQGIGDSVPAQVAGYLTINIGGTLRKVPLYQLP